MTKEAKEVLVLARRLASLAEFFNSARVSRKDLSLSRTASRPGKDLSLSNLDALEAALLGGETHYTVRAGIPELRRKIAAAIQSRGGPTPDAEDAADNVLITTAESESLFVILLSLGLDSGKVLVDSVASTCLQNFEPVYCERDGFQIEARRQERCRASQRSHNDEMEAVPPQPEGRMRVAADLLVARRQRYQRIASSSLRDLASQAPSADRLELLQEGTRCRHEALLSLRGLSLAGEWDPDVQFIFRSFETPEPDHSRLLAKAIEKNVPDVLDLGVHWLTELPPTDPQRTLIIGSLAGIKGLSLSQVGYLMGPKTKLARCRIWKQAFSICTAAPSQRAAILQLSEEGF